MKNTLSDLNNCLFEQIERLNDDALDETKLGQEIKRSEAITKIAKSGNNSEGATMYVTTAPCLECSKLIIQAGIKRLVYRDSYRITDGIDLLKKVGVEVVNIE